MNSLLATQIPPPRRVRTQPAVVVASGGGDKAARRQAALRGGNALLAATTVLDVRDLVEMRIDLFGHPVELAPFLAELGRAVRGLQHLAALPLDVIDDAIEAAVEHDRDEARLARHEPRPLLHQRQSSILLARLGLDDRDLGDDPAVGVDLRHDAPRWLGRSEPGRSARQNSTTKAEFRCSGNVAGLNPPWPPPRREIYASMRARRRHSTRES